MRTRSKKVTPTAEPTAKVQPSQVEQSLLSKLAEEITNEHEAAEVGLRDSVLHARRAGELLIQVKEQLQHGEFMAWVEANCRFKHSTATLYMKIARAWTLEDYQRVGNLSQRNLAQVVKRCGEDYGDRVEDIPSEQEWQDHLESKKVYDAANKLSQTASRFLHLELQDDALDLILRDRRYFPSHNVEALRDVFLRLRDRLGIAVQALKWRM